ncbi:hypothetical protein, partial [Providencia vermicola]|uniref:hypothetical protein n=1 Tax=Providencia vermicola TaxID=333965 RepID=UPI0034E3BE30
VQTTFGGVCGAKKGGLALHFGLESANQIKKIGSDSIFFIVGILYILRILCTCLYFLVLSALLCR